MDSNDRWMTVFAAFFLALLILFLYTIPVRAHEHGHDLGGWYSELKNGAGGSCCNGDDFVGIADPDWEAKDGRYRVRIEGKWWDVPDAAVIKDANRDGRTLVWPIYHRALGGVLNVRIRCFLPGAMT